MKIIFLDIDGVLNSKKFDRESGNCASAIDPSRLALLAQIVARTGALIVLTSSWRHHFEADRERCDETGLYLHRMFSQAGLFIADKTDHGADRPACIKSWLAWHPQTEAFVILDDDRFFGWQELLEHLVLTDYLRGYGLMETHVAQAIEILEGENRNSSFV